MTSISDALYARLRDMAGPRCGCCRTSSKITGQPLSVEHIIPTSRGGPSDEDNLWLSCRRCNEFKGSQVEAIDPETSMLAPLYHPRQEAWNENFTWSRDGTFIIGLPASGHATVAALKLNNDEIVAARLLWVGVGWHPPAE